MRSILVVALLVGCERPAERVPSTVVVYDDLAKVEAESHYLGKLVKPVNIMRNRCTLVAMPVRNGAGDIVSLEASVRCLDNNTLVRFSCRDHAGVGHPLGMMVEDASYSVYCR